MSKGNCQQVMEHNSVPLEFQLPDGKEDTLQTAQNCYQLKTQNVISSIHVVFATAFILKSV